jgi:C-terminal processing protease CtpA/Prc
MKPLIRLRRLAAFVAVTMAGVAHPAAAQTGGLDREMYERGHRMLLQIQEDLKKYYYDSTFHGVDLDRRIQLADSNLQHAQNANYMLAVLAQVAQDLHSSHTRFFPPGRMNRVDYGYSSQCYGEDCFVTKVDPKSDAATKGLKRGDRVLAIDNFALNRAGFWTLDYVYGQLNPRAGERLIVDHPDGGRDTILALARIIKGQKTFDWTNMDDVGRLIGEIEDDQNRPTHIYREIGDSVLIWKMPSFVYGNEGPIDDMIELAKKHRAVIFDLRRDRGGAVLTEQYLLGQFFDHDVRIGTMVTRGRKEVFIAKPVHGDDPYRGFLVVLIDSWSASAAEIFARVMQLERRAVIVGDRSMGAVETSMSYNHTVGFERVLEYGLQVSISDVIMSDGNRLEGIGVTPDSLVIPTGADIAARRDVVMAKALEIVGVHRTPDEAAVLSGMRKKRDAITP